VKRTQSQITSNLYVSNWKSSYDVDNEMAWNIARVKLKTIISLWNYRFYLNSENSVIHSYLYNKYKYYVHVELDLCRKYLLVFLELLILVVLYKAVAWVAEI